MELSGLNLTGINLSDVTMSGADLGELLHRMAGQRAPGPGPSERPEIASWEAAPWAPILFFGDERAAAGAGLETCCGAHDSASADESNLREQLRVSMHDRA